MGTKGRHTGAETESGFNRFAENLADIGGKARDIAGDVGDNVVRGGKSAARFVVKEVKEHPIRTLAIGAAVGAAVAAFFLLRNRHED
jgi:ElaB/YqjD/DUF883 family membrane-anchored ribosome-binding protein